MLPLKINYKPESVPASVSAWSYAALSASFWFFLEGLTPLPFKMVIPVGLVMALKPLGQHACKSEQMKWGDDKSGRPLLFDYAIYWGFLGGGCLII